jgi:opacity protein-like surface antigen
MPGMPLRRGLPLPALALALALPAGAARADEVTASPFYGSARLGAFIRRSAEPERFGTGFDVALAVGWWATPELSLELATGRGTVTGPAGFEQPAGSPVDVRLTLFPVSLTARWAFWLEDWRPYLLAGAGAWVVRARPEVKSPGDGPLSTEWTEAALGLQAGVGLVYQADPRVAVGAEGRWLRARVDHGGEVSLDGLTLAVTMEYRR